jgi:LmbE family N-acetylglucosaminyl deacetylase
MELLESLKGKKILLVVAHPDDELLGCGATFNKLISDYNCHVRVVILGEGVTSRSMEGAACCP